MKKILTGLLVFVFFALIPVNYAQAYTKCAPTLTGVKIVLPNSLGQVKTINVSSAPLVRVLKKQVNVQKKVKVIIVPKRVTPSPIPAPAPAPNPISSPIPSPSQDLVPTPIVELSSMQSEMLSYINTERKKANLPLLLLDEALSKGAYLKSQDMAVNKYFSHTSPSYGTPFEMMKNQGISYSLAGENIAKNPSVIGSHNAFMNSSGHRANILNSAFQKIGLGFYQDGPYLYVTQWFTN